MCLAVRVPKRIGWSALVALLQAKRAADLLSSTMLLSHSFLSSGIVLESQSGEVSKQQQRTSM
ncbi:MAG: hypothetical protein DI563_02495 [Variovorax paradoxus]|uniref:Uncharacterized protein n=1 Tax=Variovorax paradoxus TaxID=34073 RepID=A0A2W5QGW7_VARPD|nr:MAG: hypothetical protein DI563_02495 [Variovorax paradoxus]